MNGKSVLVIALIVLILAGIGYSYTEKNKTTDSASSSSGIHLPGIGKLGEKVVVKGIVGSEKMDFFQDPRVIDVFAKEGFDVQVMKAGSRTIASNPELPKSDFAFPAGDPSAEKIEKTVKTKTPLIPWYTPMVVASWDRIADILNKNGVAQKQEDTWYVTDFQKLIGWSLEGKKWKDLKESSNYSVPKTVLVTTTDIASSNSAAMYLSLVTYTINNNDIVETNAYEVANKVKPIFLKQGFQDSSSAGPFDDYKMTGVGKTPMVMIYEAQFITEMFKNTNLQNKSHMLLMYPQPTIFARQVFIPLTDNGQKVGEMIDNNEELQKLAIEYGWRTKNSATANAMWKAHGINVPSEIVNVINAPKFDVVESMISTITN